MTPAITYDRATFAFPGGGDVLHDVTFDVEPGELLLVAGASGSGKSTLLRAANGLVPHSSGGRFRGDVRTFGRSVLACRPRDLAAVVGFVHQDPEAQFVVDRVEADLAFVLENLGVDHATMRRRVEEVLDALGIAHLRDRSPGTLSGGEKQRCAIAGALAAAPAALVLDEPTSQLDPQGAEDVLAALSRLHADLGTTVVLSEHRLDRAAPLADRAVVLKGGRVQAVGPPAEVLAAYSGAPVLLRLAALLGLDPAPLTVRETRRRLVSLDRSRVEDAISRHLSRSIAPSMVGDGPAPGDVVLAGRGLGADLGGRRVLASVDVEIRAGEVVALLGRNGAGKTTLLRLLSGLLSPARGRVDAAAPVAYVPQDPGALLFSATVRGEVEHTLELLRRSDGHAVDRWLAALRLDDLAPRHPRSLSSGERQRVAIAAVAVGGATVLLLDEPTRGMDAPSRAALESAIAAHAAAGGAVVLATHDVELAARTATRAVVLGDGDVVADGPARDVLAGSLFAPQVLRVLPPFLTVEEVAASLAADEVRR